VIALVAALALAGVGTLVLVTFVRGAEQRAKAGEEEVQIWRVHPEVPQPIDTGTTVDAMTPFLQQVLVDSATAPAGSIADLASIAGLVNEVELLPGEILIADRFVPAEDVDTRIPGVPEIVETPAGFLTVPVQFDPEKALGGLVKPGDTVAIVATFSGYQIDEDDTSIEVEGEAVPLPEEATAGGETTTTAATHILIHRALVTQVQTTTVPQLVATDPATGATSEDGTVLIPATPYTVTFALAPADVERLVFAASQGELWLAYQGDEAADGPTSIVTLDDIFIDG
jgi:pilus assembly protein CpaB